jgi:Domain of unknown function (DUF4383)
MNRNPAQSAATLTGLVLIALGILGFVPLITSSSIAFAGEGSSAKLIGVFQVSDLQNVIHILLGLAGVALARTTPGARQYLLGGGIAFLVLWALGIVNAGKWIPVNAADDWLHLAIGVALIGLGFAASGESRAQAA